LEAIISFFQRGGFFMYAILVMGIFALTIIIERMIVLLGKNRIDTAGFVNQVIGYIRDGKPDRALEFCNYSRAALPEIVRAGLEQANRTPDEIQNAMEVKAMSVIPKLEKRTGYLSMTANVATLLGLLGTVWGLIQSFQAVAHADAAQKAALLSSGISVAMNTTAFGLITAIPCMIAYAFLHEKTNELIDEINENVARIYQYLVHRSKTVESTHESPKNTW